MDSDIRSHAFIRLYSPFKPPSLISRVPLKLRFSSKLDASKLTSTVGFRVGFMNLCSSPVIVEEESLMTTSHLSSLTSRENARIVQCLT
jgi:hypothetical protein